MPRPEPVRRSPVPDGEPLPSGIVDVPPPKSNGRIKRCFCGKTGESVCHPMADVEIDS